MTFSDEEYEATREALHRLIDLKDIIDGDSCWLYSNLLSWLIEDSKTTLRELLWAISEASKAIEALDNKPENQIMDDVLTLIRFVGSKKDRGWDVSSNDRIWNEFSRERSMITSYIDEVQQRNYFS